MASWVGAARPPTLWAAVAPVVVGSALAAFDEAFREDVLVVTLFAAVAIQVGVNFANDLADAERGADDASRIGPTRAVSSGLISPASMRRGIVAAFGVAAVAGVYLIWVAGWVVAVIGIVSIIAALGYTGGPYPYGYHGWGEVFVFVFFGLVATAGTRYVYDATTTSAAWVSGVVMGLLAAAILEANNIRDIGTDPTAGKKTLAVLVGRRTARVLFVASVAGAFVVVAAGALSGTLPAWMALGMLAAPLAARPIRLVTTEITGPPLSRALKDTARLQVVVALLMAAGALVMTR